MDEIFDQADPFGSWWPYILAVAVGVAMTIRTFMGGQRCPSTNQIERKVVIITGGYTGIGKELTKALAERGAEVIIAVKDMKKAEVMCDIMKRELKCKSNIDAKIIPKYLDLRSFENVKSFAEDICKEYPIIDILINNAGIIFPFKTRNLYTKSVDGYEMHLQVNYLAPQLLTHLLLPHIRKAENGRIINISGHAHVAAKMDIDDPLNIGPYSTKFHDRDSFAHSKLAVILGTKWLARELKGTDVTVNCFTPGLVEELNI
uniref:Uncharacterized protein n=1 Tax=Megaselia scalaris TaxID=36166 RepID=T1GQC3_MEGSC